MRVRHLLHWHLYVKAWDAVLLNNSSLQVFSPSSLDWLVFCRLCHPSKLISFPPKGCYVLVETMNYDTVFWILNLTKRKIVLMEMYILFQSYILKLNTFISTKPVRSGTLIYNRKLHQRFTRENRNHQQARENLTMTIEIISHKEVEWACKWGLTSIVLKVEEGAITTPLKRPGADRKGPQVEISWLMRKAAREPAAISQDPTAVGSSRPAECRTESSTSSGVAPSPGEGPTCPRGTGHPRQPPRWASSRPDA